MSEASEINPSKKATRIKLAHYVAQFLKKVGVSHVFGLTGGSVVHLFDSVSHTNGITPIFTHHEQAASFAAEAYAKYKNDFGVCIVTTGPGGSNAVTGVLAAYMDSIPCIYISGQSRIEHSSKGKPIRQLGNQGFDIVSLVSHITKYAVMVEDPNKIRYYLEKAVFIAKHSRPGPVWIDIPLDFQWTMVDPHKLEGFDAKIYISDNPPQDDIDNKINKCVELLYSAQKPLIIAGYGVRLGNAIEVFEELIKKLNMPFVSSWNAADLFPTTNRFNLGRIGVAGQRGGNEAVKNCDLILALGSHLCLTMTGLDTDAFAKNAKKIVVDIDPAELNFQLVQKDLSIQCDVREFLQKLLRVINKKELKDTRAWEKEWPTFQSKNKIPKDWIKQEKFVNPYIFVDALSDELTPKDTIVVDGGGTVVYISYQAFKIKKGQRIILSTGICSMGSGLPESIGACFASNCGRVICTIGDGSLQLNIQELQTIIHHNLPIKIFVFNNRGYLSIRQTQRDFLNKKYIGSSVEGGLTLPNFQRIARAYGMKAIRINNHKNLSENLRKVLSEKGPTLCEIMISPEQELISTR